jgi:hypothetical protein
MPTVKQPWAFFSLCAPDQTHDAFHARAECLSRDLSCSTFDISARVCEAVTSCSSTH